MMLNRLRETFRDNRGQALVEMALVLPILIMLLFGIIEFGRVFNAYLTVTSASREGARAAAVGADNITITQKVYDTAPNLDISKLNIEILPLTSRKRGEAVSIKVTYPVQLYAPLVDVALDNPMNVEHKTTMRVE